MSAELLYHGRPMNRDGLTIARFYQGVSFEELVEALRLGRALLVYLEPGDGTRYTLLLAVVEEGDQPCLLVSRRNGLFEGNSPAFDVWDFDTEAATRAVAHMSHGNEWTAEVLTWWMSQLCEALQGAYT